jgi:hypothetical protein
VDGYIPVDLDVAFADHGYATADWVRTVENGTGEHTGVSSLLSGSVSHYCLSHATIPINRAKPLGSCPGAVNRSRATRRTQERQSDPR